MRPATRRNFIRTKPLGAGQMLRRYADAEALFAFTRRLRNKSDRSPGMRLSTVTAPGCRKRRLRQPRRG